jgi:hypothetical protein
MPDSEPSTSELGRTSRPTIPEEVRRMLREQVNFGCPVSDCGHPYLMDHHFDPNWARRAAYIVRME